MSEYARGYLRTPRRAAEVSLDLDGRAVVYVPEPPAPSPDDPAALARAQSIVDEARERAETIVGQAVHEAAAVQHDAYREGREEGYRDGVIEARGELADAMALLQSALQEGRALRDRVMRTAERDVIELVIDVARSVLGAQVELDPTLVLDTVERALARAGAQNVVRIRLNSGDRGVVAADMAERHGEVLPFAVLDDHTVAVGGCVIDTSAGEIDARLDVQLDEIARLLRSSIPDGGPSTEAA